MHSPKELDIIEKMGKILTKCRTRQETIEGFSQLAKLARNTDDPTMFTIMETISERCSNYTDKEIFKLRDGWLKEIKSYTSDVKQIEELFK